MNANAKSQYVIYSTDIFFSNMQGTAHHYIKKKIKTRSKVGQNTYSLTEAGNNST
jgi:hypothetical protein